MQRRTFVKQAGALAVTSMIPGHQPQEKEAKNQIISVTGNLSAAASGIWLPHEHVLSRFGPPAAEPGVYDKADAVEQVVPYLKYIGELGVDTIVDCTAAYFGRNVDVLKTLAEQSGVRILTNTGYYGAANDKYIPQHAYEQKPGEIARHWIEEFQNGIQGTEVRPGFIKTAIDGDGLSQVDGKLIRAAAITHKETGLIMAVHTSGNVDGAREELRIIKEEKVSPEAWIWVHAQNVEDPADLIWAAEQGAWISLDGIRINWYADKQLQGKNSIDQHLKHLLYLKDKGYLDQVLLSHDGSSYPPSGSPARPFDTLITTFIPVMKAAGFSQSEIDLLIKENPVNAFTIKTRLI